MNEVFDHAQYPKMTAKAATPKYHSQFRAIHPLQSPNITYPTE